jgi:hypothetical protein
VGAAARRSTAGEPRSPRRQHHAHTPSRDDRRVAVKSVRQFETSGISPPGKRIFQIFLNFFSGRDRAVSRGKSTGFFGACSVPACGVSDRAAVLHGAMHTHRSIAQRMHQPPPCITYARCGLPRALAVFAA